MNHELFRQHLVVNYFAIKCSNERYSKRAYAKKLGISHGPLIEIINGKRKVSTKMAERICEKLMLSRAQTEAILCNSKNRVTNAFEFELTEDQFVLISDSIYFAFLNLIKIKSQSHEPDALAKRLGVSKDQINGIIERLCRLKMIEINKNGKFKRTKQAIKSTDDVLSFSIKAAHRSMLKKCLECLDDVPIELRDFSSITMAINSKNLHAAKNLIRKFQDDLSGLLENEEADEVYSFNMQLIPLTKQRSST